jgi:1-acyl-sn-glycerol-3-phosphate acyltransferase
VVVCNHQSTLDLPWGGTICPPRPVTIGKKEVVFIPILNLIFWALDFIRVDRGNTKKALASLEGVADQLKKGKRSLVIAPEGTRSPSGELLPFKKGAFHIAVQAQAPICPVVVHGAHDCLPKHRLLPRKGTIYIQFLEPISTRGKTASDVSDLTQQTESAIREALTTLRVRYPISPSSHHA